MPLGGLRTRVEAASTAKPGKNLAGLAPSPSLDAKGCVVSREIRRLRSHWPQLLSVRGGTTPHNTLSCPKMLRSYRETRHA
jgi:hypothetical protein